MAPLEPWEKAIVDVEKFSQTTHGKQSCVDCHGGVQSAVKEEAHAGMISSPSSDPEKACGDCHQEQVTSYPNALHNTQAGYWTAMDARSTPENHPALEEMFGNHCATCHTTCGECHVSQPTNVGGGLFSGHVFEKTPPMTRSCTACHGSRVGNEYLGKNEELPGDVHFREARMNCVKCHEGADLHGSDEASADHRYSGEQLPQCITCHADAAPGAQENPMHNVHGEALACQVCHSITYTSCDSCHTAISQTSGKPFFETSATYSTFAIGRNPLQSAERPYSYVPVRHVPVDPASFEFYRENLLPNFDAAPTWVYATPHNIQRKTPQNESCAACHANPQFFLTADKVKEEELAANQGVIVSAPPAAVEVLVAMLEKAPAMPADHPQQTCSTCHKLDAPAPLTIPANHTDFGEVSCKNCHKQP